MNKNTIKSAIEDIKATDEFKERLYKLTRENSGSRPAKTKYYRHLIAASASLVIIIAAIFTKFGLGMPDKRGEDNKPTSSISNARFGARGMGGKVCDMILYNGKLFYTDFENKLFYYDNSSNTGKLLSDMEITPGSSIFEDGGYIYYSNGTAIFERSLKDNNFKQILSCDSNSINGIMGINAVQDGRIFYTISYRNKDGVFPEAEYRIYDLSTGNDSLLFERSKDFIHILAVDKNIIIADSSFENDSGLFYIDLASGEKKKLLDLSVHEGCLINGIFYYTSQDENGLWSISLKEGIPKKITIPGENEDNFFVDRICGFGDFLYIAAYYNGENHIMSIDLKTFDTTILAQGFGRVWKLCSDGKTLYAYDTKLHVDNEGQITEIKLD